MWLCDYIYTYELMCKIHTIMYILYTFMHISSYVHFHNIDFMLTYVYIYKTEIIIILKKCIDY